MKKRIIDFCEHQEFPRVNGIIFADGTIQLLKLAVDWGPPAKYRSILGEIVSLDALNSESKLIWNDGAILAKRISDDGALEAVCGESDFGSDGFIAVINKKTKKLVWLASFDCSNPFDSVEFDRGHICARTTLGNFWRFPISNPQDFTVQ